MKSIVVFVMLMSLGMFSRAAIAASQADCNPSTTPVTKLNKLSAPIVDAIESETGDARWERQRAIGERSLELSSLARKYEGAYNEPGYDMKLHLIDAKYDIAMAEIAQVALRDVQRAKNRLDDARNEIKLALSEAPSERRPSIASLQRQLVRTALGTMLCHGQSPGEDRYQYERLKSSFHRTMPAA